MGFVHRLQVARRELLEHFSPTQFAAFRIVFGIYLSYHFLSLVPYAPGL
jgi:hypothetical protein